MPVPAIWDPEIQEEQLQAPLDQVINQAEPRGEVEDVGLGDAWRHDEDGNRVPPGPASLVAHKAHLAPLRDHVGLSRSRPGVCRLLRLQHRYLPQGFATSTGRLAVSQLTVRRPARLAVPRWISTASHCWCLVRWSVTKSIRDHLVHSGQLVARGAQGLSPRPAPAGTTGPAPEGVRRCQAGATRWFGRLSMSSAGRIWLAQ